jgi:polysaccharide biosynthesis/export protein
MSQGSDFGKRLALVALVAGLVGCAPLPIGSDSNSKSNAMVGDRLSSQNAPLPATASAFESPIAPSQTVASAATDSPMIESPPTTRFAGSRESAGTWNDGADYKIAESRDSAGIWNNGADYRISSLDILQVAIFQVPDLNRTVRVDERGFVSLPLIGQVPVRGKSMLQAQEDIGARYSKSYLQSPQVSLSLVKSSQRVTVSGAVRAPSVLTLENPLTLSMAIAQSGGTNDIANPDRVHIARITGDQVDDSVFDLKEIQAGRATNPMLRGGDIVVVEDSTARLALKEVKDVLPLAAISAFIVSDVRLKRDITPIAKLENGLRLYRYRYAWSDTLYVGVLAQEVLEVAPSAVARGADGYLRVNYARLGLRMQLWEEWVASHPDLGAGLVTTTKGRHDGDSLSTGRT